MKRLIAAAGLAAVLLSGCSQKAREPFRDASVERDRNDGPARIIEFPDGFSNMAAKCDGPNMIYSPFKGDANRTAIGVAPNDPRCKG